jgi:transposase
MLDALVNGMRNPEVLAELAKGRMRAKIPALKEALEGRFDHLHAVWIGAILEHIDFPDAQIAGLTEAIGEQIALSRINTTRLVAQLESLGRKVIVEELPQAA